ncbi:MAG: DUF2283 domain-containing protein [Nitrospirae bacterium]|nr:DUF2283 domain-containing protein [Nitrospirota bacterium]
MTRKEVRFHYDREADVLYLSVGKPQKAKSVETGDDFVLRLHPKTAEVVGLTIIDFSKHFPQLDPTHIKLPAEGSFDPAKILEQILTPT